MIIITGASGFIGSNLIADLNERGRTDLVLVDDLGQQGKWKNIAKRRFLDIIDHRDIERHLAGLEKVDAVFHLGADSSTTATDGDAILALNLRASMMWWKWCVQKAVPLIYASSAATYGDGGLGFNDSQALSQLELLRPLNLYGWSKHQFDKWAIERASQHDAPPQWVGLKFFNVYGPNEYHKGDMRSLVAKNTAIIAKGDEPVKLFKSHNPAYTDGGQLRDFIYVKDCCQVMHWLFENRQVNGIFNLGTGQARSFKDLMLAVGKSLNKEVRIEYVDMPQSIRPNYQYFTEAKMSALRSAGFTQNFQTIEQGVSDYVTKHLTQTDPFR